MRSYLLKHGEHYHAVVKPKGVKNNSYFCAESQIYTGRKGHNYYNAECKRCKKALHSRGHCSETLHTYIYIYVLLTVISTPYCIHPCA